MLGFGRTRQLCLLSFYSAQAGVEPLIHIGIIQILPVLRMTLPAIFREDVLDFECGLPVAVQRAPRHRYDGVWSLQHAVLESSAKLAELREQIDTRLQSHVIRLNTSTSKSNNLPCLE